MPLPQCTASPRRFAAARVVAAWCLLPLLVGVGCDVSRTAKSARRPAAGAMSAAEGAGAGDAGAAIKTKPSASAAPVGSGSAQAVSKPVISPRVPLASSKPSALELTLWPVQDKRWALLTGRRGEQHFAKRLLDAGPVTETRMLGARRPVMGLDGVRPWLISSDGKRLCVEAFGHARAPECRRMTAVGAALLAGRVVFLEQRPDLPAKPAAAPKKPQPKAPVGGKPPRKGIVPKRRQGARQPTKNIHRATDPKPVRMRLWLHLLDAEGRFPKAPVDTKLTFERPLPGMGAVSVVAAGKRLSVLFFEYKKARREKKRSIPQARLRVAELDARGRYIRRSKRTVYDGDRRYGYIEGHHRPQLFAHAGAAAMVGRFVRRERGRTLVGFEAIGMRPWGVRQRPTVLMSLDPWRVAGGPALRRDGLAALDKLQRAKPTRSLAQPASDAGRAVWVGSRAFYLCDDALCDVSLSGGSTRRHERPFGATSAPIFWASMTVRGEGLAATAEGLFEVPAEGAPRTHALGKDAHTRAGKAAVRIAESWWQLQPDPASTTAWRLARLLPRTSSTADAANGGTTNAAATTLATMAIHPGSSVVVGGKTHGWLLSARAGQLTSHKLFADGRLERKAAVAIPRLRAPRAVERAGGGAIVVARGDAASLAFALLPDGSRGEVWSLGKLSPPLALQALPAGGALLRDAKRALWLDEAGKPQRVLNLAREAGGCEGWSLDGQLAAAEAGTALAGAALVARAEGESVCAAQLPQMLADGRWRGFARVRRGTSEANLLLTSAPLKATAQASQAGTSQRVAAAAGGSRARRPSCPPDMVHVAGSYCVDRYESRLLDSRTALPLSPNFPSEAGVVSMVFKAWSGGRFYEGDMHAHALPLPLLLRPRGQVVKPRAFNGVGAIPSGFVSGYAAERACKAAGKRMCKKQEWKRACRGEQDRKFPYGDRYRHGLCNVHRYIHPAKELHGNTAVGHLDPRLNVFQVDGKAMLRPSGDVATCASRWGDDAIYDMVGNLDEWLDDTKGSFAGGFYARSSKSGCDARISAHPRRYLDYSLGVRCCLDDR